MGNSQARQAKQMSRTTFPWGTYPVTSYYISSAYPAAPSYPAVQPCGGYY
jgi:hypothetical protein